ncbi:hypothetical protein NMW14_01325, partial [Pasteurella multocida]|nr:hypothetical protein [Pasteurella multocida]
LTLHKAPSYLVLNNLFPFITTKSLSLFIFPILSGWIHSLSLTYAQPMNGVSGVTQHRQKPIYYFSGSLSF